MKALILSVALVTTLSGQPQITILHEFRHNNLPFERRIENSGIYGIASFDFANDILYVNSYDSPKIYAYKNGTFSAIRATAEPGSDFVIAHSASGEKAVTEDAEQRTVRNHVTLRRPPNPDDGVMKETDGVLSFADGQRVIVTVPNRATLRVVVALQDRSDEYQLPFPGNLGYAECLGLDRNGNIFLLAETYVQEVPLKVDRFIYVIDTNGSIQSILKIPVGNQLSLVKEFIVDGSGDLNHLFSNGESIALYRWNGLNEKNTDTLFYPQELYQIRHRNEMLPTEEPVTEAATISTAVASRSIALRLGEQYVLYTYRASAANLSPIDFTAPDGDIIRTPSWLVVGVNAHVPYKWGGFSTLAQFADGLKNGKYAGDINTASPSSYAVGVDCSGFVSRCWQLSSHYSTSMMPNITVLYPSWDSLKPADAVHKVGHVRLFVERTPNGGVKTVESTSTHWDVSYYTYAISALSVYSPRYYTNMQTDHATERPVLHSVIALNDTSVLLRWSADTSGVLGYRLYSSENGTNWQLHTNENSLQSDSAIVVMHDTALLFRVSRVLNNGLLSESNWSNVLGASLGTGMQRALIVDGFENEASSWKGPGHPFVTRYAAALNNCFPSYESVRNSEVSKGTVSLKDRPMVFWFSGDESVAGESISAAEQSAIAEYLAAGGSLFINGSEIGYDLWEKGSVDDRNFYTEYLKASYVSDNASVQTAEGVIGSVFGSQAIRFGQNYLEEYPDVIDPAGGSYACLTYSNGKGAGVQFFGTVGGSSIPAKLIYIGFPVETIADDSCFDALIGSVVWYFLPGCPVAAEAGMPDGYALHQNYPNPFNPSTTIRYALPTSAKVTLSIYDMLGREISVLVNEEQSAGWKEATWNVRGIASGMYVCKLTAGEFTLARKMLYMK
ncbi:MAG: T9SS type A sorting domain-containing protein [Bacteroidota bacterium]